MKSNPLAVNLKILLVVNLALANPLNELGWDLDVVIDQESKAKCWRFFQALYQDTSHRIDIQVVRHAIRSWTNRLK